MAVYKITDPNEEFIELAESIADTQKKIKTWVSSGYTVTILYQTYMEKTGLLLTTLTRRK